MRFTIRFAVPAALALALAVAGCGFRPLYETRSDGTSAATELAAVTVEPQNDRTGQLVRNRLVATMSPVGSAAAPAYRLAFDAQEDTETLVLERDTQVSRRAYRLTVRFRLVDLGTGQAVYSGRTFSQVSYDRVESEFANIQARIDAAERAAREVADDIRLRLAGYFASA